MKNDCSTLLFMLPVILLLLSCSKSDSKTPTQPSTAVETVTIGTQVWMLKNLDVSNYRNGDPIPQIAVPEVWINLTTGAWDNYQNHAPNDSKYGKLYNWYAVNDPRGLAPVGFHIPSDNEWNTLVTYLGGEAVAGVKLKTATEWQTCATCTVGTNSSGFTALPGGCRPSDGICTSIGGYANWWSSTEANATEAWTRPLSYDREDASRYNYVKHSGYYVRCIKD